MSRQIVLSGVAVLTAALLFAANSTAQQQTKTSGVATTRVASERIAANRAALKKFVDASNQLSPEVRKHLSRALQNYLLYANAAMASVGSVAFSTSDVCVYSSRSRTRASIRSAPLRTGSQLSCLWLLGAVAQRVV